MSIKAIYTPIVDEEGNVTGRSPIAADGVGTGDAERDYPVVKAAFGAEGAKTLVDAEHPLPSADAAALAKGEEVRALLALIKTALESIDTDTPAGGALTNAQLRQSAVPVSLAGGATETTLAAILAKIIAAPATEATSAAILAKLIAAPATEATSAAILAKLIAAPATEATSAAILAKLIAAPATEATSAAILAKLIAAPATEAKQDTIKTVLDGIKTGSDKIPNSPAVDRAAANAPAAARLSDGAAFYKALTDTELRAAAVPVAAGGYSYRSSATLTRPNDANAYADGDEISNSTTAPTALELTNCARANGGTGVLSGVTLVASDCPSTAPTFELWVFDSPTTPSNDNAAFAPSDADAQKCLKVIPLSNTYKGDSNSTGNRVFQSDPLVIPYACAAGSTSLYARLVVRSGYTPTAQATYAVSLGLQRD